MSASEAGVKALDVREVEETGAVAAGFKAVLGATEKATLA